MAYINGVDVLTTYVRPGMILQVSNSSKGIPTETAEVQGTWPSPKEIQTYFPEQKTNSLPSKMMIGREEPFPFKMVPFLGYDVQFLRDGGGGLYTNVSCNFSPLPLRQRWLHASCFFSHFAFNQLIDQDLAIGEGDISTLPLTRIIGI